MNGPSTPLSNVPPPNASQRTPNNHTNDSSDFLRYPHLPTPQSPHVGPYVGPVPQTPESPLAHGPHPSSYPSLMRHPSVNPRKFMDELPSRPLSTHQIMTPESSPLVPRVAPSHHSQSHSLDVTPKSSSKLDFRQYTPPPSSPMSLALSSPFRVISKSVPPSHHPTPTHSPPIRPPSSRPLTASISTPPISPAFPSSLESHGTTDPPRAAGGEMERIRMENMHAFQDLESRRPDYLVRSKRNISELEPPPSALEGERDRSGGHIGITDSPNKGRRITLFQETSEESFEESLMAGGYGRYRTADWVRQPQPMAVPTPGPAGPSNIVARLEEAEEPAAPPTEKELKKRKRLAAFQNNSENGAFSSSASKLYPVELEGKGRVLLDIPNEAVITEPKKRGSTVAALGVSVTRRKKKAEEKRALAAALTEEPNDRPNWPDAEFPWRLRTEERSELAKADQEERMKWIEKFLDRDTDEEDDNGADSGPGDDGGDEEVLPSSKWGVIYEDESPIPFKRGRGKMVPLHANPAQPPSMNLQRRSAAYFPSDPADARAALLSKKSVRALSYRQQCRLRNGTAKEMVCICRGTDDGRELVQCDDCKTWFHLQCLGIRSILDLGREEDPWYCHDCVSPTDVDMESKPDSSDPEVEPTFVPTDEAMPRTRRSFDTPFFQQVQDSPLAWGSRRGPVLPRTPTQNRAQEATTPRYRAYPNSTPGPLEGYGSNASYDDHFDPTSTPSRGLTTPKNNPWPPSRVSGGGSTPLRMAGRGSRTFGGPGFLSSTLDDSRTYEYSPVRRDIISKPRRILETSLSKPTGLPEMEMSPVARAKGKERLHAFR